MLADWYCVLCLQSAMNTPETLELTNDAIIDSQPPVSQRARDLLCSLTAKREQLEKQHKSAGPIAAGTKTTSSKLPSSAMTIKIQEALREKRNRLRKHLYVDQQAAMDDHQDHTQTTETSTATPGASPYVIGHIPIKVQFSEVPDWTPLSPSPRHEGSTQSTDTSPVHGFSRPSKSFDDTQHSSKTISLLRRSRSFDGDRLVRTSLSVSKRSQNLTEDRSTRKIDRLRERGDLTLNEQDQVTSRKITRRKKYWLGRRSKSFDTSRQHRRRPQIKLSLSLDRELSHEEMQPPRGDRTQHLLRFNDIEVPPEISPIDTRPSKTASSNAHVSRRTGTKIAAEISSDTESQKGCILQTREDRVAYINELYHSSSKVNVQSGPKKPSDRRKEKAELNHQIIKSHQEENRKVQSTPLFVVGHNYERPTFTGEDLMKLSLTDNGDRREMLRRLQLDLHRPKPIKKMMEAVRQAAAVESSDDSSTEQYLSFSDDSSSCDFTTTSETTGIGSVISTVKAKKKTTVTFADLPPRRGDLKTSIKSLKGSVNTKQLRLPPKQDWCIQKVTKDESTLCANPEEVEGRCVGNGGLFAIAANSGLDSLLDVPMMPLPRKKITLPLNLLSTDYRCGTYGSSYDIALRSGHLSDTIDAPVHRSKSEQRETKEYRSAALVDSRIVFTRGSLYDIALQSGLTKQMIRSRSSFTFTVHHRSKENKPCVVSPMDSDNRCGACGSVFLATTCIEKKTKRVLTRKRLHRTLYAIREIDVE